MFSCEGRGMTRSINALAVSLKTPVGSPFVSRTISPPGTSEVLLSTPAICIATRFARLIWPSDR
jgi:hypothetical protein